MKMFQEELDKQVIKMADTLYNGFKSMIEVGHSVILEHPITALDTFTSDTVLSIIGVSHTVDGTIVFEDSSGGYHYQGIMLGEKLTIHEIIHDMLIVGQVVRKHRVATSQ